MSVKKRILDVMKFYDYRFPDLKFDEQGNLKKRCEVEVEPYDAKLIFEDEGLLRYILTRLFKYLKERLIKEYHGYICFGGEDFDVRWIITEQFCQEMGIDSEFVDLLIQHVDSPCEGEFLNEYSVDDVLEEVRSERQQDEGQSMNKEVN